MRRLLEELDRRSCSRCGTDLEGTNVIAEMAIADEDNLDRVFGNIICRGCAMEIAADFRSVEDILTPGKAKLN